MSQPSLIPATPTCAVLELLLPLAAHDLPGDLLDAAQAAAVRDHLASCAHCQRDLALHARVDVALRQAFAVRAEVAPPFTRAHLAALITDDAPPVRPASSAPRDARRQRPRLPLLAGLPAAAAVLLVTLFAGYLFHLGGRGITGSPTATPAFHLPPHTILSGIAATSPTEWWAVGVTPNPAHPIPPGPVQITPGTTPPMYIDPIIVHYAGGRYSLAALPLSLVGRAYGVVLSAIAMTSPNDGWAVGNTILPPNADGMTSGVLLHYTGGKWTLANAHLGTQLDAIAMRSGSDGWIAGQDDANNTLVLHYNGAAWTPVNDPALAHLTIQSIATPAPNDIWMVGYDLGSASPAAIVHYDGVRWSVQSGPCPNTLIFGIAMTSAVEGWALAVAPGKQDAGADAAASVPATARVLHYANGVWEQQAMFTQPKGAPLFDLMGVAVRSANDGWAVGSQGTLIHYSGGRWIQVHGPTTSNLYAVTLVGASDGWAVGDDTILRLSGGQWHAV